MDMDETRISTAKTPSREVLTRISEIRTNSNAPDKFQTSYPLLSQITQAPFLGAAKATEWRPKIAHGFNRRTNHRAISKSVAIRSPILQEPFAPTLNP